MTTEELLKQRYEVIMPYPEMDWKVGEVLDRNWSWGEDDESGFNDCIDNYPHLFRKLHWWEKRSAEEMPEYVKTDQNWTGFEIIKVSEYYGQNREFFTYEGDTGDYQYCTSWTLPATESEYNNYINSKTQSK